MPVKNSAQLPPYQVLGVSPKASPAEITAAYKVLAQIFHPDRFADSSPEVREQAEARMKDLNEAYSLARKGHLVSRPPKSSANGSSPQEPNRPGGGGPGFAAYSGVPWDVAVRTRAAKAAKANEERRQWERQMTNGNAVRRPRPPRSPSVLTGLGMAMWTGNIQCKGCQSLQWLPQGWKESLDDAVYHCSICDRLLLSR